MADQETLDLIFEQTLRTSRLLRREFQPERTAKLQGALQVLSIATTMDDISARRLVTIARELVNSRRRRKTR